MKNNSRAGRIINVVIGLTVTVVMAFCAYAFIPGLRDWVNTTAGLQGEPGKDGQDGQDGQDGANGLNAYELAVELGYSGTLEQWLNSLIGSDGANGKSTYEIAVELGYEGTEEQWLAKLFALIFKQLSYLDSSHPEFDNSVKMLIMFENEQQIKIDCNISYFFTMQVTTDEMSFSLGDGFYTIYTDSQLISIIDVSSSTSSMASVWFNGGTMYIQSSVPLIEGNSYLISASIIFL